MQAIRSVRAGDFVCDPALAQKVFRRATRLPVAVNSAEHLTRRELDVLKLAATGLGNRNIAAQLGLAERTVKGHLMNIFDKMSVSSRTEAVREALKRGWVSIQDE